MTVYCQLCGRKIAGGRGHLFHHKLWPPDVRMRTCTECAQTRPRCRECGLPVQVEGLCATCSRSLKVCLACGRPIKGKYYTFDGNGDNADAGPYCAECFRTRPPCDVCAAPLTQEYWQLSDGRVVCAGCHSTAVYSPQDAAELYAKLKTVIADDLGLVLNIPTGVALVDRNQLRQVIEQQDKNTPQAHHNLLPSNGGAKLDADNTLGLYARRGMRRGIYVQTGLPRQLFIQIAAHEFAHAWQGENCPLLRDTLVHEGFAEWVAYRAIGRYGYSRGQERMRSRKDIYGDGLRWALEIENRSGVQDVIDACRKVEER